MSTPRSTPTDLLLPSSGRWLPLLILLYSVLLSARLATVASPAHLTVDDGYYYLGIARNIARGLGSTWDGVNLTNGYHPLWLLSLVPVYWLSPSPEIALRSVFILQAALMAVAAGLLFLVCRRCVDRKPADPEWPASGASCLAVLFWLGLNYRLMFSGLEYGLWVICLLAVTYVRLCFARQPPGARAHLALGILLAVAFLARIENLLLAGLVVWSLRPRLGRPRQSAWRLAALCCPVLLVAVGYAIVNWRAFGHPLPISGVVKAGWSRLALEEDVLFQQEGWLAAKAAHLFWPLQTPGVWCLTIAAGSLGISLVWFARRRLGCEGLGSLAPFIAFSNLSYLTYVTIYHGMWSSRAWYYAVQPVLAAILLAVLLERWSGAGRHRWWGAVMTTVGIWLILRTVGGIEKRPLVNAGIGPILEALAELPEDAAMASWNGGALSYLSGRPMVSLDGLVNSREYALSGRLDLCRYWQEVGISHLVDAFDLTHGPPFRPVWPTYSELHDYRACGDQPRLVWSDTRSALSARVAILEIRRDKAEAETAGRRGSD